MISQGVLYCATTNDNYLSAALISAIALRKLEPTLAITLISDRPLLTQLPLSDYGITPHLILPDELGISGAFLSRAIKTQLARFSPYAETLFLDADILPIKPIGTLWDYLDQGDLAMVSDRNPTVAECDHIAQLEKDYTLQLVPSHTPHFNSGVMLWRDTPATQDLFQQWHREWQQFQKQDQLALVRALQTASITVLQLPITYNISPRDAAPVLLRNDEVYLLHCWGGVVGAGEFPAFAKNFYPDIVDTVAQWLVGNVTAPDYAHAAIS
jgi:Nucleotide-diphospho-sugar transferase